MNRSKISKNKKAVENGKFCEEYARRVIPGIEWVDGIYDAKLNGVPLDVKSCEMWYNRYDRPNSKRRSGMLTLSRFQYEELKKQNGLYFCIVHFGELIVKSFFVPAVNVPDYHQISWTTMKNLAVEVI